MDFRLSPEGRGTGADGVSNRGYGMKWLFLLTGLALGALAHFAYSGATLGPAVRSDLVVYRDPQTGCEYLKAAWSFAGLTPRNDSLGVPICEDEEIDENVMKILDGIGGEEDGDAPPVPMILPPAATPPAAPPPAEVPAPDAPSPTPPSAPTPAPSAPTP
jgi:hypothetical protein